MRKVTTVPFVYTEAISVSILKKQADVTSSGGGGGGTAIYGLNRYLPL